MSSQFFDTAIKKYPNKTQFIKPNKIKYVNSVERPSDDGTAFVHLEAAETQSQADSLVAVQP